MYNKGTKQAVSVRHSNCCKVSYARIFQCKFYKWKVVLVDTLWHFVMFVWCASVHGFCAIPSSLSRMMNGNWQEKMPPKSFSNSRYFTDASRFKEDLWHFQVKGAQHNMLLRHNTRVKWHKGLSLQKTGLPAIFSPESILRITSLRISLSMQKWCLYCSALLLSDYVTFIIIILWQMSRSDCTLRFSYIHT
jgi:hypothetical protein